MKQVAEESRPSALGRWAWFIGLWIAGVITVGSISLLLRWILLP